MEKRKELLDKFRRARDDRERAFLLDQELPDLVDLLDLQISASDFDPKVRKRLLLDDDEVIFLVLTAVMRSKETKSRPEGVLLLFTNKKLLALTDLATRLFDSAYLNTLSFDDVEMRQLVQKQYEFWLKTVTGFWFGNKLLLYPIDYDVIYDLRHSLFAGFVFKRKDRPASEDYSVAITKLGLPLKENLRLHKRFRSSTRFWGGNLVIIKKRGYPLKQELRERFSERDVSFGTIRYESLLLGKLFSGALKRVPEEQKKIMSILSKMKEVGESYITEITVTKESFSQLRCENCGAGEFRKSATVYKAPAGTYALLKCTHCGFEGTFLKHGLSYKVAFPKSLDRVPEEEHRETENVFCRFCGANNLRDAIFCQKCGKKMT